MKWKFVDNGYLSIERVDAHVAEGGTEEVLLCAVLQQGALQSRGRNLLKKIEQFSWFEKRIS